MKRKVTVWANPNDPEGFRLLIDEPPVSQVSTSERAGDDSSGGGSITLPADYEHLDLILAHDPSSVGDNYSSLIVVEQNDEDGTGWRPVYEFYAEDTDAQLSDGGQVTIVGPHIKAGVDDGVVGPLNSANPHWEWGAPTLTRNADLSESSTTSEEINIWVSDGASGSFTVDVDSSGSPATIDVGDSASDVKTAFESLSTVEDVRVSGSGTEADPWHVIFNDPDHVNVFMQTNDAGLTGTLSSVSSVEGGQASPSFWLKSQTVDGIEFGNHTGTSGRVVADPLDANKLAVEVSSTEEFAGMMQILDVNPGQHYATVEVLPANGTEEYRLVIRTPDEGFVASSGGSGGYEGITLTDGVWNTVETGQFEVDPEDGGRVFIRIAVVSPGNPGTFYVRNLKLHPGFPPTTAGDIVQTLKDGAEGRGALDWLANDFDETVDSNGDAWDTDELAFQADAGEKLGTHVLGDLAASTGVNKTSVGGGYEWNIVRIPDDDSSSYDGATHLLKLFNPGQMGSTSTQAVVVGTTTGGRVAKRRVPFTHLLVRTYDDEYVWVTDARLSGIPRREEFYDAEQARDIPTAQKIGGQVFDAMIENLFATEVQLGGPGVRAYRDFGIGWTVPYVLGSKRAGRHDRRIHSITMGFDGSKWTDTIHASRMYAPGGKDSPLVLEGLAKLYRLFNRRRRPDRKGAIVLPPPVDVSHYTDATEGSFSRDSTTYSTFSTDNSVHAALIPPDSLKAGDLYWHAFSTKGNPAITGGLEDYTVLYNQTQGDPYFKRFVFAYKVADGTETTENLTFADVCRLSCVSGRTPLPAGVTPVVEFAGPAITGVDSDPLDARPITPTTPGLYAVLAVGHYNGSGPSPNAADAPPAGYELVGHAASDDATGRRPRAYVAGRAVNIATSEDPGPIGWSDNGTGSFDHFRTYTIAIRLDGGSPAVLGGDAEHNDLAAREEDDNHPQYSLIDGTRAFTGPVTGVAPTANLHLATKKYVDDNAGGGGGGGGSVPQWMEYLAARQSGETSHADDDFFADDDHTAWTKLNVTGNQTVTEKYGILSVVFDSQSSSDLNGALKALTPSTTPVTIETAFRVMGKNENFTIAGLVLSDGTASSSNIAAVTMNANSVDWIRSGTFTSAGAPVSGTTALIQPDAYSHIYMRLIWKSANTFAAALSPDGVSWTDFAVADSSRTLTPTHFGLVWSRWGGGTEPSVVSFDYVRVYETDLSV